MINDINFDLAFHTSDSLVFNVKTKLTGVIIEIHIHVNKHNLMYITLIITDKNIIKLREENYLHYINDITSELQYKLYNFFGLLKKGDSDIEVYFHINFNSVRINFAPWLFFKDNDEFQGDFANSIFREIKGIYI
ncbi:MAG: hypothetical protein ABF633_01615 [Clostridium sp.]|uniref:hypothetical protein n=1 Tax=Clostridium sp. TaxID=1506 RepID=UPI0039ECAD1D